LKFRVSPRRRSQVARQRSANLRAAVSDRVLPSPPVSAGRVAQMVAHLASSSATGGIETKSRQIVAALLHLTYSSRHVRTYVPFDKPPVLLSERNRQTVCESSL